jgi:hypothetical protein
MKGDNETKTQIFNDNGEYRRATLLFVPIVAGVTIFFGLSGGIKGAIVGFVYGLIGGLFLIHESLAVNKKTSLLKR